MAKWSVESTWSVENLWGIPTSGFEAALCKLADERVLVQMDDAETNRKFRDLMCIFAEPFGKFADVATDVQNAFDITTAEGEQLDFIGRVIGLQRSGFGDTFYRTILQIQSTILQGQTEGDWTGSVNQILSMVRTFIGTGVAQPVEYTLVAPYGFELLIPSTLTPTQIKVLFRLICRAVYAGVLGFVTFVAPGPNLWQSHHGAVANGAIWCSFHGATATPCGEWGFVIVTDGC